MTNIFHPRWGASLAATAAVLTATAASAQTRTFDIPVQPAATGVKAFAAQADVQVVIAAEVARGRRTNAVKGALTVAEALERLLAGTGLVARAAGAGVYSVVETSGAPTALAAAPSVLEEVVVTAQKREQSLQDVPIAVTALTRETLQVNRITTIMDLNALAPNLTVLTTAGSVGIPTFGMRGVVSSGSVPGQDKSVSLNLDGVYLGSAYSLGFDLPDLERIEVLRGPQGTLFGRNATAGAINIITRNPSGRFSLHQQLTAGNHHEFKSVTRLETPAWGPLSASISYTHDERRGDIKNLGAGRVWDLSAAGLGVRVSPRTLGDKDSDAVFAAVKFEPNDSFSTVYKFDWMQDHYTPEGEALVVFTPEAGLPPEIAGILRALYTANPPPLAGAHRPKFVNNAFVTPSYQKVYGHNLTSNLRVNDQLSLKNILAYRHSFIFASSQTDGLGSLVVTPATSFLGPVGSPYLVFDSFSASTARQWSDEVQLNYSSKPLTLTAGALYFDMRTRVGQPSGIAVAPFTAIPGGVFPLTTLDFANYNTIRSAAAYAQAEVRLTPQLDVVGGYRITKDKKSGTAFVAGLTRDFRYRKTKPSYLAGVNYRPIRDTLVYAKYSTGFVSGGSVSTIDFQPETVKSWEGGLKSDLLERRLRLNFAVFSAKYKHLQAVSAGPFIGRPELGTIVVDQGNLSTKGFEGEISAVPMRGVSLNGSLGYTDFKLSDINTQILGPAANYRPNYRTHWTATASAQYETEPLFGEARVTARLDGVWRAKMRMITAFPVPAGYEPIAFSPAGWVLNGRVALRDVKAGPGKLQVALWGRNLTDSDRVMFPIFFGVAGSGYLGSTSYEPARAFGVDVIFDY